MISKLSSSTVHADTNIFSGATCLPDTETQKMSGATYLPDVKLEDLSHIRWQTSHQGVISHIITKMGDYYGIEGSRGKDSSPGNSRPLKIP